MADITEKTGNGELVTNRDQLVGVDNIEPLIKIIRGQQVMLDRDLAVHLPLILIDPVFAGITLAEVGHHIHHRVFASCVHFQRVGVVR